MADTGLCTTCLLHMPSSSSLSPGESERKPLHYQPHLQSSSSSSSSAVLSWKGICRPTERARFPLDVCSSSSYPSYSRLNAIYLARVARFRLDNDAEDGHSSPFRRMRATFRQKRIAAQAATEGANSSPAEAGEEPVVTSGTEEKKKSIAALHDFCLGITFGLLLVAGGAFWFLLTRSPNAVRFGVGLGGILLATSVASMKAWQAGAASTPYVIAQAALSFSLFVLEVLRFLQTGALFPTLLTAIASLAMVGFYAYNIAAGGNPLPKSATP
eukprot:TRINITY_DN958_c0_g1_i2.p1 TRINITY_DN958_c0_g1~~TRINITY_DN958_c0_g1_i2.p1  ORF type:complete len:296 (+),score=72.90 TRINITY_DN958_c0_g1_i2:78-890(+)